MSTQEQTATDDRAARIRGALGRFRVAAYTTGVGLLGLVVVMAIRLLGDNPGPSAVFSPIHGVIYMIYMVITIDLALKARWSIKGTIGVLLAGCVPLVSFVVERMVTKRVQNGQSV
ncbi:DUF3817 domain-containing protein [Amycolatopsis suaedae]|uniref:DUF3817 domain-containing protein n=1 Tax=Amycolatopsis suaedae TaxID=2510978 RepID=A0A4Q7J8D4_9PSEU|nr:DUF3817 domain-containing protein [Amycolatopsis suaedae]RZQ63166.1 DUF3817 domain-containing protein [Amycolatopsis suaedae]